MLVKKAECLVFMKLAGSLAAADEALFDLIHPLAEGALQSYMQDTLSFQQHIEYLPLGKPQLENDYPLDDIEFRSNNVAFVNARAGTEFLQLKHLPVASYALDVRESVGGYAGQSANAFDGESVLTIGQDYFLDVDDPSPAVGDYPISRTGILYRVGAWPAEPRSVRVAYYAGWSADQFARGAGAAVKLAALQTVAACFWSAQTQAKSKGAGPYSSESIGKYSYSNGQFVGQNLTLVVPMDARALLQPFRNYGRLF